MAARALAGLALALTSVAQIRGLVGGVRAMFARSVTSAMARIHVSAMSIEWLRTYEDESDKHRADI